MSSNGSFQIRNPEDVFSDMSSKFTDTFTEDEMPEYLKLEEVNPYNHVGWGLSKEDADMLSEEKE